MTPRIKIELDDGTGTWVTFVPIHQRDIHGVLRAAGEAFALFLKNLVLDTNAVEQHVARRD